MKKSALFLISFVLITSSLVSISGAVWWGWWYDYSLPKIMSAMGDSMTQAVNVDFASLGVNPENSWSTGYSPIDFVFSHFERIRFRNPLMRRENAYNNAVDGARIHGVLTDQLPETLSQGPEYVTILIGSNDACHGTDLGRYEEDYRSIMDQLTTQLPDTKILLVSAPDIARLVSILGRNSFCHYIWKTYNVCPKLLQDDSDVEAFKQYVIDMNAIIMDVANDYGDNARYVDIYHYPFGPEHVSDVDCFHPDLSGQRKLSELAWNAGFFAS